MKKATLWFLLLLMFRTLSAQTTVSITVKDAFDYTTPVSGATVTLAGVSVVTVDDGLATFVIPTAAADTNYSFTVSAPGYIDYQNDWLYITANSETEASSAYISRAYSVSFIVVDKNNVAVAGAVVEMNELRDTSDLAGQAGFIKKFASGWNPYNYTITAEGYADYSSSIIINNADTILDTIVLQLAYDIKLSIKNGSDVSIEGASVLIGDELLNSESDGTVTFNKKVNGNYSYQISKSGYIDAAGTVTVMDKDTAVSVLLTEGHDLKITVINGASGNIGLPHDTITIGSISKITDDNGVAVFGLDTGNVSFTVKKAGFLDNPVSIHVSGVNDTAVIFLIPVYNVYFTIVDEFSYMPIQGVNVSFNGSSVITDENGIAAFLNLAPSDSLYSYTLTSESGYNPVNGTISLPVSSIYVDQFNIVNSSLTMNKPGITIILSNGMLSYYGQATINVNGVDYEYNTGMGSAHIEIAPGTYKYIITPLDESKAILKGLVEVGSSGYDYQVYDVTDGYKVEIYAADIHSNPIAGATVVFAGDTVITDDSGDAVYLRRAAGDFTYSVRMTGYKDVDTASLSVVTSDVLEISTLHLLGYTVNFHVTDGNSSLEDATVEFNSSSVVSDAFGMASFEGLSSGSFDYMVSKNGFIMDMGSVEITDADVNKEVVLLVNEIKNTVNTAIFIYPNPVTDRMNISLGNRENNNVFVSIIDLSGRIVKTASFENPAANIEMNVNEMNSGTYLVKVQTSSGKYLFKLIKK